MTTKKRWLSPPPKTCDICECHITKEFVDGKTSMGPWACMCMNCHRENGGKLGLGLGQQYRYDGVKYWIKVAG